MNLPKLDSVPRQRFSRALFYQPAIYTLWSKGRLVYIGSSLRPEIRIGVHHSNFTFDSFQVFPCPRKDMLRIEDAMLRKFQPRHNRLWGVPEISGIPASSRNSRRLGRPRKQRPAAREGGR